MGYFGSCKLEPTAGAVTYDIAGASAPSYVGSGLSTHIRFDGDRLIIMGESMRKNGERWTWERVLAREQPRAISS